jgi:uncharacterized protein (DUF111 family)
MHPEYDDARAAAKKTGLPLKKVLDEIAALVRKP